MRALLRQRLGGTGGGNGRGGGIRPPANDNIKGGQPPRRLTSVFNTNASRTGGADAKPLRMKKAQHDLFRKLAREAAKKRSEGSRTPISLLDPKRFNYTIANTVSNGALKNMLRTLYQPNDKVRGGTAGAVRKEVATGLKVGNRVHSKKASQRIIRLKRILEEEKLNKYERNIARLLINDLQNSLSGI